MFLCSLPGKRDLAAVAVAFAVAVGVASPSQAATYQMSFTSAGGDVGSLRLVVGGTTVTAISGTIDSSAVTGLSTYAAADQQLLFGGTSHFTVGGLSFAALNGVLYNLTSYPDNYDHITNSVIDPAGNGSPTPYKLTSLSISPVPLPTSSALLIGGLLALGLFGRRRRAGQMLGAA